MRRVVRWFYDDPAIDDETGSRSVDWFLTTFALVLGFILVSVLVIAGSNAGYTGAAPNLVTFAGVGLLTGATGFATGGFVGFLFGVPRVSTAEARDDAAVASNTNLEQVSDWLTKIIVGVGLVEFAEVNRQLLRFRDTVDGFMHPVAAGSGVARAGISGAGFATALILVGSAIAGFLAAYLKAKTDLMGAFAPRARVEGRLGKVIAEQILQQAGQQRRARLTTLPERCARDVAATLVQLVPASNGDPKLHELSGLAHAVNRNFRAAAESFQRAIELAGIKASPAATAHAIRAWARAGDVDRAFDLDRSCPEPRNAGAIDRNERALARLFALTYARGRHAQAIALGEELTSGELARSGRLWLYLTVAYAQWHAATATGYPDNAEELAEAQAGALNAARTAIRLDRTGNRPVLHLLWDPGYPGKDCTQDSLQTFYPDPEFEALLAPGDGATQQQQGRKDDETV